MVVSLFAYDRGEPYHRLSSRIPGLKIPGLVVVVPLLTVSATSCRAPLTIQSGALNTADSAAYDALPMARTTMIRPGSIFKPGDFPLKRRQR